MTDDKRLLVEARNFENRIPAVGAGGFFGITGLYAVFALEQELNASA